ncbi:MAG: hypothetical protein IT555_11135 [Acetobacteraceae bacterium]|nr:hypothetical protein [Acetobacteraceae bacterium]
MALVFDAMHQVAAGKPAMLRPAPCLLARLARTHEAMVRFAAGTACATPADQWLVVMQEQLWEPLFEALTSA